MSVSKFVTRLAIPAACVLLIGITAQTKVFGQSPQPLYTGAEVTQLVWSPDSKFVTFLEGDGPDVQLLTGPGWAKYNVNTNAFSESDTWPLKPNLTSEEFNLFKPLVVDDRQSFIFQSADQRYIVYNKDVTKGTSISIGDRQTKEVKDSGILIDSFYRPDDAKV